MKSIIEILVRRFPVIVYDKRSAAGIPLAEYPTVRIGKRVRISRAGLAEWVRAQEQNRARA